MEWSAPGIVLAARAYGEGDALAAVFTRDQGVFRGLARGGASRAKASTWQAGNLVEARWIARLPDQLGSFTAELVHASAALAMHDGLALAVLSAACAVAEAALAERQPQPRVFQGLLHLLAHTGGAAEASVANCVRWELDLLAELGFGLDLASCAATGATDRLAYVSPRTGRAVAEDAAGEWSSRLLVLPRFLRHEASDDEAPVLTDLLAGLRLTGHFLTRDAFGAQHKPLPQARVMLQDRLVSATGRGDEARVVRPRGSG